jgi:hypothetical protein
MNWHLISKERFRALRKQGENLTLSGGCIYSNQLHHKALSMEPSIGTYFVWLKAGQPFLRHDSYYNGKELFFTQAEKDTQS